MQRASGILLAISSLPSKYGIGCFSKEAYAFVDWLKDAGQHYWQILPMGPTGYGDSPYQSFSTFAGNPYFIDLEKLIEEGLLTKRECDRVSFSASEDQVDYLKLYEKRYHLLRKAYERSHISEKPEFHAFLKENEHWIYDYSLYMAVKQYLGGVSWEFWPEDIKYRWQNALDYYRGELYFEVEFQQFMQFLFHQQWVALRSYANQRGIKIIGDIPIYVAMDSSDAWAHPELFQLDGERKPCAVAGCPPDNFSADGQLWGNPLYNWEYHRTSGYQWWITRMQQCFSLYDVVRIDHFRGFDEYYSIPYGDENAVRGHWEKGPGMDLFYAIRQALGEREVIAEDLGFVTDSVRQLVYDSGFPGMKVLEFAFDHMDSNASAYYPHVYQENCVAYTGTHDNETLMGWWKHVDEEVRQSVRTYLCDFYTPDEEINFPLIGLILRSAANLCIVPLQDYMGLDDHARMNTPSTLGGNWNWRLTQLPEEDLQKKIAAITRIMGR
ncbi:MAG: 4-alpha-glucanotransferase [Lachnospiraceae bacterium]|nr:4-alpha-glucanotransferase [Lachnospiraceae bacterium]